MKKLIPLLLGLAAFVLTANSAFAWFGYLGTDGGTVSTTVYMPSICNFDSVAHANGGYAEVRIYGNGSWYMNYNTTTQDSRWVPSAPSGYYDVYMYYSGGSGFVDLAMDY